MNNIVFKNGVFIGLVGLGLLYAGNEVITIDCLNAPVGSLREIVVGGDDAILFDHGERPFLDFIAKEIAPVSEKTPSIHICCNQSKMHVSGLPHGNRFALNALLIRYYTTTQKRYALLKKEVTEIQSQDRSRTSCNDKKNHFDGVYNRLKSRCSIGFHFLSDFSTIPVNTACRVTSLTYGELQSPQGEWNVHDMQALPAIQEQWRQVFNRFINLESFTFGGWYLPAGLTDLPQLKKVDLQECVFPQEGGKAYESVILSLHELQKKKPGLTFVFPREFDATAINDVAAKLLLQQQNGKEGIKEEKLGKLQQRRATAYRMLSYIARFIGNIPL